MTFVFAYAAGLLTLINPCILPVLPIAVASASSIHRAGPLALVLGMGVAFTALGVGVSAFGASAGLSPELVSAAGAVLMAAFGAILLIPRLGDRFATVAAGVAGRAGGSFATTDGLGLPGQFLGGVLLGAVWSPCIGPTLGGAIALASQGSGLAGAAAIMAAFSAGVGTVILAIAFLGRDILRRRPATLQRIAALSRPILGTAFLAVGLMLWLGLNHVAEAFLLEHMPAWLLDLSVTY